MNLKIQTKQPVRQSQVANVFLPPRFPQTCISSCVLHISTGMSNSSDILKRVFSTLGIYFSLAFLISISKSPSPDSLKTLGFILDLSLFLISPNSQWKSANSLNLYVIHANILISFQYNTLPTLTEI